MTTIELNGKSTKELKELAKEFKVKNWWTLNKAELVTEISKLTAEPETPAKPAKPAKPTKEMKHIAECVKQQLKDGMDEEKIKEAIDNVAVEQEVILHNDQIEAIYAIVTKPKQIKSNKIPKEKLPTIVYAEKDGKVHIMKEFMNANDLYQKYKTEYKHVRPIGYNIAFGIKENNNPRLIKEIEFIKNRANKDITITHEILDK